MHRLYRSLAPSVRPGLKRPLARFSSGAFPSGSIVDPIGAVSTINDFFICVDTGDTERFASLHRPDATVTILKTGKTFTGRDELQSLCSFLHTTFAGSMHFESNHVLTNLSEDGTSISNLSYWSCIKEGQMVSCGSHVDKLAVDTESQPPAWRFVSREVHHSWAKPAE
mmetsp:Transcript_78049/g.224164  ORF Transcript_78049/g.224164 Transcript_78049/m.224164 type:complete len:168 (-) Transcript_78049:89-592(-)